MPQSPLPVSEDEVERSTDEDLSGDLLQVRVILKVIC